MGINFNDKHQFENDKASSRHIFSFISLNTEVGYQCELNKVVRIEDIYFLI